MLGGGTEERPAVDAERLGLEDHYLTSDDVTEMATRLWRLRDALSADDGGRKYERLVGELCLAVESLRGSFHSLATRALEAEVRAERLEASESYRLGNALIALGKSPIRGLRRTVREGLGRRRNGPPPDRAGTSRSGPGVRPAPLHSSRVSVVCLMVGMGEDAARRWIRSIVESAILSGGFAPVFVVDADLEAEAAGFPVVRVIDEAAWALRPGADPWRAHVGERLASVLRVYGPARLVGLAGALGQVGAGEVNGLLHMLTEDETLGAAVSPARVAR